MAKLIGTAGNDILSSTLEADLLQGESGNDTLIGNNSNSTSLSDGVFGSYYWGLLGHYGPNQGWTNNDMYPRKLADVNGDGRADIIGFGREGVYVALAQADGSFAIPKVASTFFDYNSNWGSQNIGPREIADVNGDGRADLVGFEAQGVLVALGQADGTFGSYYWALRGQYGINQQWTNNDTYPRKLADVNGDGRADIIGFGYYGVYVSLAQADGTFASAPTMASTFFDYDSNWKSQNYATREIADVNGDGRADLVGF
ncbi:FG-GAP repeat domain-containing protein, partial [Azospirillum brasilense]|uniref:FG-GAP repeat domain-containing protein n=1 Tax=Azospirillum brasilense TaxID=192 RepID=UPI0019641CA7